MRHGHQRHQDGASPERQNAELKSALQGPEPLFEGHLAHAERVQSATGEAWRYVARKKGHIQLYLLLPSKHDR